MKRLICLLAGCLLPVAVAVAADEPRHVYVGGGAYFQTQPYAGADAIVLPSPVLFADNRLFYVRWTRVGMYVFGQQNWGVSVTAQPRPFGYKGSDAPILAGMAERRLSWEAGLALGGEFDWGFAELTWFRDVLDNSNGSLLRLELGRFIERGKWTFVPSVFAIRYDAAFNDYYYGVRPGEATTWRPAYRASAGVNFAAQAYVKYSFTPRWHFLGNLRGDLLAGTIQDSPLVDKGAMFSGLLSVMYSFDY